MDNYELYHYGVKGMKWGVRRYENKDGTLTPAGKKRYSKYPDSSEKEDEAKKKGLTDKQKKMIIAGAAVAGTCLAVYGGYKLHQLYTGSGQEVDPTTGFRMLSKDVSDTEILSQINPGRVSFLSRHKNMEIIRGSSQNCMLCTTAYDLRKRGYDVHAGYSTEGFTPQGLFKYIYKNCPDTTKIQTTKFTDDLYKKSPDELLADIEKHISKHGSGSRGNIMVWWKVNGGHSMIWENVDGKIQFKDGQTNRVYADFANEILKHAHGTRPVELLRTDNLEINPLGMKLHMNTDTVFKTYVDHGAEIAVKVATDPGVQAVALGTTYATYAVGNAVSSNKHQKG